LIIRILGQGKYKLDDSKNKALEDLDSKLTSAVDSNDEAAFRAALDNIIGFVKSEGTTVDSDHFGPSDLTLPHSDSTLQELKELLSQEG
jgi:hypothetical protein